MPTSFALPELPYAYDALEPYVDAATMMVHHDKHHQTYTDKLNEAVAKHVEINMSQAEDLLRDLGAIPEDIRTAIRNHGGGYVNHNLFWLTMAPPGQDKPGGKTAELLTSAFGAFESFKEKFTAAALGQFGSGWAWLVLNRDGKAEITSTSNQDTPLSQGQTPLLCLDVWEHAYYLKYQSRRPEYVDAWWHVVNWAEVEKRLAVARTK